MCTCAPRAMAGWYGKPEFRVLCAPPWMRSVLTQYFQDIQPDVTRHIGYFPTFANGGPAVRLMEPHMRNHSLLQYLLDQGAAQFASANPVAATVWEALQL